MKFNPQLKEELRRYETKLAGQNVNRAAAPREEDEKPKPLRLCNRPSERVLGGEVLWKPVNRAAAMMLAKAPWWAQPPQVSTQKPQPDRKDQSMIGVEPKQNLKDIPPGVSEGMVVHGIKSPDQLNRELATEFVKRTSQTLDKTGELLEKSMDARAAMDVMCESWDKRWLDFQETSDARLKELRMTRMSMDSEMRQLLANLREVRAFFLDKDYAVEVARLKEFVETCERLQKLKESGFLDAVTDTMLRLSA